MKKIALSFGLLLWLVGCMPSPKQLPALTPTNITTTPQSSETISALPLSTKNSFPTNASSRASTPTRTPIPSPTTDLAASVVAAQEPSLYASYPSPDGKWRMDILIYDCVRVNEGGDENAYEQLLLVDLASGEERVADEQLQSCGGLGAFGFEGRYWSPDSNYFYYTTARQGVPDGCGYWKPPLSRVDVAAPHTEYLGMGTFSTDGGKIATWNSLEQALVIWDITGSEIARFPAFASTEEPGPIIWSPDNQTLFYLQVHSWCPLSGKSYLVEVDLLNSGQTLLLESEGPTFGGVAWAASDELSLFDENGKEWRYNLLTNELTQLP